MPIYSQTSEDHLIAYWDFDVVENGRLKDRASGIMDEIDGHFRILEGVIGYGLKCDGFTTSITRDGEEAPEIVGPFTIQAWVAPQAYPWNWCAVYNQEYNRQRGIFFGIDAEGHVGLHAAITRQWRECISEQKIPFMQWSHIAATFDPESGIQLFINGQPAGALKVQGNLLNDKEMDLQIARNHKRTVPSSLNRAGFVRVPASYSFDGIIDELKISAGILSQEDLNAYYQQTKPQNEPPLTWRKLPRIPTENTEFGAFYTKLQYDQDWDRLWRDGRFPDIVVTFPNQKYSMVFWKGTNYNMNLVTDNGKWIADQSAEWFGDMGCMEHMSDKQNRYSHVRLIENNEARVVVHWRYALTDVIYQIANTDPVTNWGDWADEYYTIYPDGIAVRRFLVHGGGEEDYSITEPAVISNPGEKPEDNIDMTAVTLANLKGEVSKHSYETWPGDEEGNFKNAVDDAVISVINVKSVAKPFYIYEHGTSITPYGGGIREIDYRYSKFHSRNHWPVSQIPCDGRFVLANDRVTSSAITSPEPIMKRRVGDNRVEGRFIMGLSDKPIKDLIPYAKFWLSPPEIKIHNNQFTSKGFNKNDRAYHISKKDPAAKELKLSVSASPTSPLVNPVFVIENWGNHGLECKVNDIKQTNNDRFKYAINKTLESKNLIIWLEIFSEEDTDISMIPL
jgi:hypothetical protein